MTLSQMRYVFQVARRAVTVVGALPLSTYLALTAAVAGEPVHSVRGHSPTFVFSPPNLEQLSINARQDADGSVEGIIVFPTLYLAPGYINPSIDAPDYAGWIWVIDVDTLIVAGNVAWVGGVIVHDNRFDDEGNWYGFTVVDNGAGANDPPDLLLPYTETDLELLNDPYFASQFVVQGNFNVN